MKRAAHKRRPPAQAVRHERQQENQARAEEHIHQAEAGVGEVIQVPRAGEAGDGQCGVRQGRAVVLVVIVFVTVPRP